MIKESNYLKAYVEIQEILNHMPSEEVKKIDPKFLEMINNKKDKNYNFKLDNTKEIKKQKVLRETKIILAYIFFNYLATDKEKEIINKKFKEDIIAEEKLKKESYS